MESEDEGFKSEDESCKSADEDCRALVEQAKVEEKELRNKRRWLLGFLTSEDGYEYDRDQNEDQDEHEDEDDNKDGGDEEEEDEGEEDVKRSIDDIERCCIPESLLREDDVSYDIIKSLVRKDVCSSKNQYNMSEDEMQLVDLPRDVRGVLHLIKDMTNQGLDRLAEALTGGSVNFEKTRWKMVKTIKECLLSSSLNERQKIKLSDNQYAVLKNPHNYCWSSMSRFIPADSASYRAAVYKILGALEALPTQTLRAMHRKMKGVKGYMPQLIPPKRSGWGRDTLIKHLRKKSLKLISKLKEGESLQEPLAKAMDIAGLNLKLVQGCEFAINFVIQSSTGTIALQNEIAKCIKLLDERIDIRVLRDIQRVLIADGKKVADTSLRTLVRNLLTDYLYECGDMEIVPECLHQVLSIMRKSFKAHHLEKMKIDEDVESVLSVSACMKQLVWDWGLTPEDEKLDQEFADAYMEDLEDSCDDDDDDEHDEYDDDEHDEYDDDVVDEVSSSCKGVDNFSQRMHLMSHHFVRVKSTQHHEGNSVMDDVQTSMCKNNQYLAVQAATDEASIVAYRLIDHILNDHGQIQQGSEQLDTSSLGVEGSNRPKKRKAARNTHQEEDGSGSAALFKAVEELLPSLAKKCEGLKKLK